MNRSYSIIVSEEVEGFESECRNCIQQLKALKKVKGEIVKLILFVNAEDVKAFEERRLFLEDLILNEFEGQCPAFNILAERPAPPTNIAIEAAFVAGTKKQISYRSLNGSPYSLIEGDQYKELWACGLGAGSSFNNIERDSHRAFQAVIDILEFEEMNFDHIVRQWNYIGEILKINNVEQKSVQNYQVFNEIRAQYYRENRKTSGYPAATGIGTAYPGVSIDICAIEAAPGFKTIAVNNEKQQNPFAYGQEVLVGEGLKESDQKQPPQFERARLLLGVDDYDTLFLSGTASIIGQETVGIGDVAEQSYVTISNIEELRRTIQRIENDRSWRYIFLRGYVKNREDFSVVEKICKEHFPEIPIVLVQADVCRDNLLVEIEGELSTHN